MFRMGKKFGAASFGLGEAVVALGQLVLQHIRVFLPHIVKAVLKGTDKKELSAQDSIPYQRMFPDGICRVNDTFYTKTVQFQDINYQLSQNEDKSFDILRVDAEGEVLCFGKAVVALLQLVLQHPGIILPHIIKAVRLGQETFRFSWDWLAPSGLSTKDFIAPSSFEFKNGRMYSLDGADLVHGLNMEVDDLAGFHVQEVRQNKVPHLRHQRGEYQNGQAPAGAH